MKSTFFGGSNANRQLKLSSYVYEIANAFIPPISQAEPKKLAFIQYRPEPSEHRTRVHNAQGLTRARVLLRSNFAL